MISARWNLAVGPVLMMGGAFVTVVGLTLVGEVSFLLFPQFFFQFSDFLTLNVIMQRQAGVNGNWWLIFRSGTRC
jgi:uncharacterized membrane protein